MKPEAGIMMESKSKLSSQITAAVSASMILIGNGFHVGWASPSLAKLQSEDSEILITSDQGSWIVSFMLIGSIVGSIVGVPMVDRWGRKTSLLIASVPSFISCLLIAFAKNYLWFYIARFVAGAGIGVIFTAIPMYMGEIAEDRVRGGFGVLITFMLNTGYLVAYAVGPWVNGATFAAVGAVIPIIFVVTFVWVPESPYYYAIKSVPYEMEKSLTWLRGTPDVIDEMQVIKNNVELNRGRKGTLTELITVESNRKAFGLVMGLLTSQQLCGLTPILAYSTIIFDQVDSGIDSSIAVIITGVVQVLTALPVIFLADKWGRKPLLLTSILLCVVFLLAEALYFELSSNGTDVTSISWLPVVAMIGFLISFQTGLGTVPMAMSSEMFPCEIKAFAITCGAVYLCAAGVVVTKFYQIITDAYGIQVAFYSFGGCSVASAILIYFFVPETKGLSLSEIQDVLKGSQKSRL